jgi:hypothetical protein
LDGLAQPRPDFLTLRIKLSDITYEKGLAKRPTIVEAIFKYKSKFRLGDEGMSAITRLDLVDNNTQRWELCAPLRMPGDNWS